MGRGDDPWVNCPAVRKTSVPVCSEEDKIHGLQKVI